ncbi:MAG TPA: efflux RND transporter periplasmic adaptor subunit [Vicinamibacterales bacterium]|nr:efflux RND transporter periplasmic adaptor subunit [Vicinamibacterales bacterium]
MTRNLVVILFCAASAAACGGGGGQSAPAETAKPATPPESADAHVDPNEVKVEEAMLRDLRITTAAVESRTGAEDVTLLGELAVDERNYAEVGVPVPARAMRLMAGPGDQVRAGEMLVELQSPELGKLRAEYVSAQARLTLAEGALKRKRELAAEKIVPLREVQEAETDATQAQAAVRSASAALTALGVPPSTSGDAESRSAATFGLRSPVAGTVLERNIVQGQMLDPATPAFRIANLATLWLTVHAFERDAVRIAKGANARLTFSALPGEQFPGVVTLLGGQVAKESRTIPIRIDVRNQRGLLRPGMSASAAVPVGASASRVLTVPVAAVQRVRNEWCVFLPKNSSTFEIRKIGRGRDLGDEVEVLSGLKTGEKIVVEGAFLLKSQAEKGEADHHD